MSDRPRFHLAFPVHDLEAARSFYAGTLGCAQGRESDHWIDFDFHGHQIVAHLSPELCETGPSNAVDGKQVPVRHFGLLLDYDGFDALAERLKKAGADFVIEPYLRFAGEPGEQKTMFVRDPSGNALEFKAFADDGQVFAT
ncbi:VOC family protein [Maricaulaceae bacterium EIL42A08]|nr:VOC family protein [Maricaulaceae bacterium EIL42A08]MCP2680028.1 VOC family protein [Maricaulaceae bacterium NA33B04]